MKFGKSYVRLLMKNTKWIGYGIPGGKNWTYEYKYRRGGQPLCSLYAKDNCIGFMIIFGKDERIKFEDIRDTLSNAVCRQYDLDNVKLVVVGGESDRNVRLLDNAWALSIREQCIARKVHFEFRQCGTHFIKDGKSYTLSTRDLCSQARKANQLLNRKDFGARKERENLGISLIMIKTKL